jgi:hypothetical protein
MKTLKTIIRKYLWLAIVLAIAIRLFYPGRYVPLANGGSARIKPALFSGALPFSNCKIVYYPKNADPVTIVLHEDSFTCPIMLFPASDGHSLFCWYFNDINTPLLKFDPRRIPYGEPVPDNLKEIVYFSTCHVEEAGISDWEEARAYLAKLPAKEYESELISSRPTRQNALQMVQFATESVRRGQGPYPWDH